MEGMSPEYSTALGKQWNMISIHRLIICFITSDSISIVTDSQRFQREFESRILPVWNTIQIQA
jgi:hypothetical protein